MKLAIYRAMKCGTEYNARKPPTIVAFVIMIKAGHRFPPCHQLSLHAFTTRFSEALMRAPCE